MSRLSLIPLRKNSKKPSVPAWKDIDWADPAVQKKYEHSYKNFGWNVPHGLVVLDVDVKGDVDGAKTLADLEDIHGKLPEGPKQVTPSGGWHLVFSLPEGTIVNQSNGKIGKGLDVRSNYTGYIVVEPSTIDGKAYQWVNDSPNDTDDWKPPLAPVWLVELANADKKPERKQSTRKKVGNRQVSTGAAIQLDALEVNKVKAALAQVKVSDIENYDSWLKIGLALNSWCGGSDVGLNLWIESSTKGSNFTDGACEEKWNSFDPNDSNGVTISSLYYLGRTPPLNDEGLVQRLKTMFGDLLKYNPQTGAWLKFDGVYSKNDTFPADCCFLVTEAIVEESRTAYSSGDTSKGKALYAFARKSQNMRAYSQVLALAAHKEAFRINTNQFDRDVWKFGVKNGLVDLKTEELSPYKSSDYITKQSPVLFEVDAQCPQWDAFLLSAFNHDKDMVDYLARVIGYTLSGSIDAQSLWLHYGAGANGKSTFLSVITKLAGDYATTATSATIMQRQTGSMTNDLARLQGARLVSINELEDGKRLNEAEVKNMTGGEVITARFLHSEFFEFVPEFKLHLTSNYRPTITDTSHGMWRRLKLIHWAVVVAPENQDTDLGNKLSSELSGILNWALAGSRDYLENGMQTPARVEDDVNKYRLEQDAIAQFIEDRCVLGSGLKVKARDIYATYKNWCDETNRYALNQTKFGLKLSEKKLEKKKTGGIFVYSGIVVNEYSY